MSDEVNDEVRQVLEGAGFRYDRHAGLWMNAAVGRAVTGRTFVGMSAEDVRSWLQAELRRWPPRASK